MAKVPYKVKVTAEKLNVRPQPNKDYQAVRVVTKGTTFTIYKISGAWGRISPTNNEWVMLQFTEKI